MSLSHAGWRGFVRRVGRVSGGFTTPPTASLRVPRPACKPTLVQGAVHSLR
jgi:hypothetical protein